MSYEGWSLNDLIERSDALTSLIRATVRQYEKALKNRNEIDDIIRQKLRE